MVKRFIRYIKLLRWRNKLERQIDELLSLEVDESSRCLRKHETYGRFREEFHPIQTRLQAMINIKKATLNRIKAELC